MIEKTSISLLMRQLKISYEKAKEIKRQQEKVNDNRRNIAKTI